MGLGEGVGLQERGIDNEVGDDFLGLGKTRDKVTGFGPQGLKVGKLFRVC